MSLREEDDKDTQGLLRRLSVATGQSDPGSNLHRYLSRLPSTSSFEDISAILRTQLVIHRARVLGCEAILWGDSTTRLAERTLAETAKGRGFSLPWLVNDSSPHGIELIYPLRDLLRKELALFTSVTEPSLERYITRGSPTLNQVKSSKKSTIDGLMTQYFESVEQNYPSIVNNVVRTGSKLRPSEDFQDQSRCQVCNLPLNDEDDLNREELKNREEGSWAESDRQVQSLCYGCHRSTQGSTSEIMKGAG
ncbi:cytoplasmic tRNA 2-thiolation protein 2 [Thelotrema lepadinum]|nr:cytoplasmic tRNA 2-thiolation protein 2 [Thelotrema lepadinum]